MKAAFSVEGEGFDEEGENDTGRNLIHEFIEFIKVLNRKLLFVTSLNIY